MVSSHITLRNCCGLDNKEESRLEKDKNVGEKRTPETNCYLTPMRPRQNIQYQHRAADNVRKWKGYDRRAAALMAHPSSRLFSCNKVIVHRIAWNGWYISSSKSREIKCNKQHLLPATKPFLVKGHIGISILFRHVLVWRHNLMWTNKISSVRNEEKKSANFHANAQNCWNKPFSLLAVL